MHNAYNICIYNIKADDEWLFLFNWDCENATFIILIIISTLQIQLDIIIYNVFLFNLNIIKSCVG